MRNVTGTGEQIFDYGDLKHAEKSNKLTKNTKKHTLRTYDRRVDITQYIQATKAQTIRLQKKPEQDSTGVSILIWTDRYKLRPVLTMSYYPFVGIQQVQWCKDQPGNFITVKDNQDNMNPF